MIELLLVLAILGVLVAVVIPSFRGGMVGTQMATTARSVVQAARYARSMAIVHQAETELVLTSAKSETDRSLIEVRAAGAGKDSVAIAVGKRANRLDLKESKSGVLTNSVSVTAEATKLYAEEIAAKFESKGIVFVFEGYDDHVDNEKLIVEDEDKEEEEENPPISIRFTSNGRCRPFSVRVTNGDELSYLIRIDVTGSGRIEGYGDEDE